MKAPGLPYRYEKGDEVVAISEVDSLQCMYQLEQMLRLRFSDLVFELQGADEFTAVGWFTSPRPGSVRVLVVISDSGDTTISTGEGLAVELESPWTDAAEVVSRAFETVKPLGDQGVELVRIWPFLGPLSPSWVGPPNDAEITRAMRHRCARVARSAAGWKDSSPDARTG